MLTKLSRETLAEQAARNLLAFIEAHDLRPGGFLPPETQLAADLGVSRPIIREALKSLEGRGIIEVRSGKGAVIKPLDPEPLQMFFHRAIQLEHESIIDLIELRRTIEVQSATLAAGRRTDEELAALAATVAEMRAQMQEPSRYVELDIAFHQQIATMSHNSMIAYVVGSIRAALTEMLQEATLRPSGAEQLEQVQLGHEAIYKSIEQGDPVTAERAMIAHFDDAAISLFFSTVR
jgi:GntR family transcriptional repressor for pyruvate dehydrogenase complex